MMQARRRAVAAAAGLAIGLGLASVALAWLTGGLTGSFLGPDESAHYVNTLFIADWLRAGLPAPMAFARDFYVHYPKLSIGHWPPGWYALLAPAAALWWPGAAAAAVVSAFVAGLPAILPAWALTRAGARRVGIAAALAMLVLPLVVESARAFLLDQPVALVAGLAAIAWLRAAERPGWRRFLLFGALAAFAPLVKGNGALVALIPPIEIALSRRWALLRDRRLWATGALTALVVAPWYYVSFRISAGGFNYAPGPAYAWLALRSNAAALLGEVGAAGVMLSLWGAAGGWRDPRAGAVVRLALAAIAATLAFQSIVPVALDARYVLPAVPWCVALAALGVVRAWRHGGAAMRAAAIALPAAALASPVVALVRLEPKRDMAAPTIVAAMRQDSWIWMVDGRAGGEGAIIAEVAHRDCGMRTMWVARASQWLAGSDFMGRGYHVIARTPDAARTILDRIGVSGVVIVRDRLQDPYPHSAILLRAVTQGGYIVTRHRFARGLGEVIVARRDGAVLPHVHVLEDAIASNNLRAMTRPMARPVTPPVTGASVSPAVRAVRPVGGAGPAAPAIAVTPPPPPVDLPDPQQAYPRCR